MPVEELLEEVGIVVQAGRNVIDATALFNDIGNHVGYAVQETIHLTNGTAQQLTVLTAGAGATVTTGFGLLSVDVGVFGAMAAPALGIIAGVGLYNLSQAFWDALYSRLNAQGLTIGRKVWALIASSGTAQFPVTALTILKDLLIEYNYFKGEAKEIDIPETHDLDTVEVTTSSFQTYNALSMNGVITRFCLLHPAYNLSSDDFDKAAERLSELDGDGLLHGFPVLTVSAYPNDTDSSLFDAHIVVNYCTNAILRAYTGSDGRISLYPKAPDTYVNYVQGSVVYDSYYHTVRLYSPTSEVSKNSDTVMPLAKAILDYNPTGIFAQIISSGFAYPSWLQDNAIYPTEEPIPVTYPTWVPLEAPLCDPTQETEPGVNPPTIATPVYPLEIPSALPQELPQQIPAQNPDPQINPEKYVPWIIETTPIPSPYERPTPSPIPTTDPDANNETLPTPDNPAVPDTQPQPDPPNPNVPLEPNLEPLIPPTLDTFPSGTLFTVYNPSSSQLDALGNYLWSGEIIDIISKIWQNPLSAVISLHRVYKAPTVSTSKTIRLGMLDSGVSAPVVSEQFRRFSCGSVLIKEQNKNVTDYSPYASVHIYLPFIGIVPLDVDEVMGGTIEVVYSVDMYTGACLAEVRLTRQPDVPVQKILYTFNGTASQSMPLTSADATGLVSSIAGLGAAAIGVVSGGGALGGAAIAAHSLTHELLHVGHSGSLSANAGIMGQRIPFVIIGRRFGYDANAYGQIYGYPTNKTVYLGNCDGFTRVKAIQLKTEATQAEKNEIEALLKDGVIF